MIKEPFYEEGIIMKNIEINLMYNLDNLNNKEIEEFRNYISSKDRINEFFGSSIIVHTISSGCKIRDYCDDCGEIQ